MTKNRKKPKHSTIIMSVDGLIDSGYSIMGELKSELQDWYDNINENFQNGDKGDQLQTAIDCMDEADNPPYLPPLPDSYSGVQVEVRVSNKRRQSRSDRRDEAVGYLSAAINTINDWVAEYDLIVNSRTEDEDEDSKPEDEFPRDDLDALTMDLENAMGEFENVDFPGMFG